ncbi:MAG: DUF4258 domain-containing protein [Thermoleophilia bacterium]
MPRDPEMALKLSAHARRRMRLRSISVEEVLQVIALCPKPKQQSDGTLFFEAWVGGRPLGVVRALDATIVTVLDFSR